MKTKANLDNMDKRIDEPESVQFTIYSMHRTK